MAPGPEKKRRPKGVYCKMDTLADGTEVIRWYHRKTGARLPDDPDSDAFRERVKELDSRKPARPQVPARCFKDLFARYRMSSAYLDLAASTRAEYDRHMRHVEPAIGLSPVAAFTADHMDRIMGKFPEHRTLAHAIRRTISAMLTFAARTLKWIASNPILGMEKVRKRQEEGQKPYTEPEIATFRTVHPYGTRERLTFEIGLATAFRREDIARVKGPDILAGLIPLLTGKAGVLVVAPVTRHLLAAYLACCEQTPGVKASKYALGCQRNGQPLHKRTVSGFMEAAFEAAGFEEGQRLHALRYTAAVRLFERNLSYEDIAEATGHRMASMAQKYCEKRRGARHRQLIFDSFDDALDDVVEEAFLEPTNPMALTFSRAPMAAVPVRTPAAPVPQPRRRSRRASG